MQTTRMTTLPAASVPQFLTLLALLWGVFTQTVSAATEKDVERWVDKELTPYLVRELTQHPRFKGATLQIVTMVNGRTTAETDELSLRLRDRLQSALIDAPNVNIAWQPLDSQSRQRVARDGSDCQAGRAQYVIGIELRAPARSGAEVSVRALDAVERTWVNGVGATWRGELKRRQWTMARTAMRDRNFLGQRSVPYEESEKDLLAAHLAHDLRCELMRQVSGEYVVSTPASSAREDDVARLVGKNIAGLSSLSFSAEPGNVNALLETQAFPVDGSLHQYWVTLTPTDPHAGLQPISTSVYVNQSARFMSAEPLDTRDDAVTLWAGDLLTSTSLVRLDSAQRCQRAPGLDRVSDMTRGDQCLGIEVATRDDAVVFVLKHQQNHGLVRLGDRTCSRQTAARVARADTPITVSLPDSLLRDAWMPEPEWRLKPDADTYYTIAVSDSRAARAISRHLESLPRRCTESLRPGLKGTPLADWLTNLSAEAARWQPHVDWNAIKIKNIY